MAAVAIRAVGHVTNPARSRAVAKAGVRRVSRRRRRESSICPACAPTWPSRCTRPRQAGDRGNGISPDDWADKPIRSRASTAGTLATARAIGETVVDTRRLHGAEPNARHARRRQAAARDPAGRPCAPCWWATATYARTAERVRIRSAGSVVLPPIPKLQCRPCSAQVDIAYIGWQRVVPSTASASRPTS